MSIVSASSLSASELRSLGNNVLPAVRLDRRHVSAVNRSLQLHDAQVERLFRRAGSSRMARLAGLRAAV